MHERAGVRERTYITDDVCCVLGKLSSVRGPLLSAFTYADHLQVDAFDVVCDAASSWAAFVRLSPKTGSRLFVRCIYAC